MVPYQTDLLMLWWLCSIGIGIATAVPGDAGMTAGLALRTGQNTEARLLKHRNMKQTEGNDEMKVIICHDIHKCFLNWAHEHKEFEFEWRGALSCVAKVTMTKCVKKLCETYIYNDVSSTD